MDHKSISNSIRKEILRMHFDSNASHIASSLSVVDILVTLYFSILNIDPKNPSGHDRDRLILSKGHAASALYSVLAYKGFFDKKVLREYCMNDGALPGHSTRGSVPGVEVSTGSLGHGLSMGIGMCLASRQDKSNYRVFVVMSDGECEEGAVWEAAMFASHHKLDNLVAIIDYNKLQAFGRTNEVVALEPLKDKWASFGWEVKEVDGHDHQKIKESLMAVPFKKEKPSVLIAHTIKGKGVSFMEDKLAWHYKSPSKEEFEQAIRGLS